MKYVVRRASIGLYTQHLDRVTYHLWTAPFPSYLTGWSTARWALIESIDGLEFS